MPSEVDGESTEIDKSVADAISRIESEARRIEIDTRIAIQEKSKKWVATSAGFLVLALGILAFFGVREIWQITDSLRKLEQEATKEVDDSLGALRRRIGETEEGINKLSEQLKEDSGKVNELGAIRDNMQRELDDSKQQLKETKELADHTRAQQEQVNSQLDRIQKLQNSFFTVYVMYPGSQSDLTGLLEALRDAGYSVLPENVLNVTVDRTEVLYYDERAPDQIEEVRQIVENIMSSSSGPTQPVSKRYVSRPTPRDLLIKLRSK